MLMAEGILRAFGRRAIPMDPARYQELARWVRQSFQSIESGALRGLRDVAPPELRRIAENVLHDRQVIAWPRDDVTGLSAYAEWVALLRRCRGGQPS